MSEANKILLRLKLRFDIYRNWHKYQEQRHFDTNEALLQKEKQETNQLQLKRLSNSTSKIKSQKNGFSGSATKRSSSSCALGPNSKISNNARSQSQILSSSSSYSCAMDEIDSKSDIKPLPLSSTLSTSVPVSVKSELIEFDQFNGFQELNNEDLNFYLNDHSKDQGFIGSVDELLDTACNDQDLLMDPEFFESFFDELVDQDQSYQTGRPLLSYSQVSTRQQHQLNSNLHFQNNQARSQNSVGLHPIHQAIPISAQMSNASHITSQSSPAASKKLQQLAEQAQAKHNWTPSNVGNMSILSNNIVPASHNQLISSPNIINQPQMISQSCLMQNSMISSNQQCYNNNSLMNINMNNHHSNRNDEQSNFWPQQRKDMPLNSSHSKLNPVMMSQEENHCKSNHSNLTLQPLHTQPMNRPLSNQIQIQPQMNSQPNDQYRQYWPYQQPQPNQIQHDYNQSHQHQHHLHSHHNQHQQQQVILSHNQHYYNNFDNF